MLSERHTCANATTATPSIEKLNSKPFGSITPKTALFSKRLSSKQRLVGASSVVKKNPVASSFHHLDPDTKEFEIGNAYAHCTSPKRLRAELAKCVCVCHNCHAKIHANLVQLP